MAEYRPDTCAWCHTETWCEKRHDGRPQCRACKVEKFFEFLYRPLGYTLLQWQRDVLRGVFGPCRDEDGSRRIRQAYISVAKKNGKAIHSLTPIPTPRGWSAIKDLRPGDEVFDESGCACRILATTGEQEGRPCYAVHFSDGQVIVADAEHEWVTRSRRPARKLGIWTTEQIYQDPWIDSPGSEGANHSVDVAGFLRCPERELAIPPYTLGAWLGDGTGIFATLTVSERDWGIVKAIESEGVSCGQFKSGPNKTAKSIRMFSAHQGECLQTVMRKMGLLGNKHIPGVYLRASVEQRRALLRGLMDTDGYAAESGQCEFTTISHSILHGFLELVRSLGYKPTASIGTAMCNGKDCGPKYRVQFWPFSGDQVFGLERKQSRLKSAPNGKARSTSRQITAILPVESHPVVCIQVDSPSHTYLCGESMVPTHNSFLIGGLPIYHLTMEDEIRPEAYGAAAAKDQASIVFRAAKVLVQGCPAVRDKLRIIDSTKRIIRRDGNGFYQVLSADGDVQDGIEPSLIIKDELHRWKTAKAFTLNDVLSKGTISRREPLDIAITTAGAQYESELWWSEYEYARQILSESLQSDRYFAAIWAADEKRIQDDPEYWKSRGARVAANPSHEDLGGFLKDEAIVAELDKAIADPSKRSAYLRYHLNVPLTTSDEPAIDMYRWQECGGGVDLRTWPEYDPELLIRKWGLIEKPCYAGIDASWTTDLTALALLFPPDERREEWVLMCFCWLPKDRIPEIERRVRVPLSSWVDRGFIQATPGNAVDLNAIEKRLKWAREMFELREIGFDPYNYRPEAMRLRDEHDMKPIEVRQGYLSLSQPTKKLLSLYLDRQIWHGNNPVLNWNAGCVRLLADNKDNVQPKKPDRSKAAARIDLFAAAADAMHVAILAEPAVEAGAVGVSFS